MLLQEAGHRQGRVGHPSPQQHLACPFGPEMRDRAWREGLDFEGHRGWGQGTGRNSLLCMAKVIAEVQVAGRLWDGRGFVGNADVLQVQEPQLELHGQQDIEVCLCSLTCHLLAQKHIQPIRPEAELGKQNMGISGTSPGQTESPSLPCCVFHPPGTHRAHSLTAVPWHHILGTVFHPSGPWSSPRTGWGQ